MYRKSFVRQPSYRVSETDTTPYEISSICLHSFHFCILRKNRKMSRNTGSDQDRSVDRHDKMPSGDHDYDDYTLDGNRRSRRKNSSGYLNGNKSRSKISSAESRENMSGGEEDDEDYGITLTNIASGQMLTATGIQVNDFFGDSEIGTELTLENFTPSVTMNSNEMVLDLKSEAFEPRINLNVELPENDDDIENALELNGSDQQQQIDKNHNDSNVIVIVEDQTSSVTVHCHILDQAVWSSNEIIKETLQHYADCGDVSIAIKETWLIFFTIYLQLFLSL